MRLNTFVAAVFGAMFGAIAHEHPVFSALFGAAVFAISIGNALNTEALVELLGVLEVDPSSEKRPPDHAKSVALDASDIDPRLKDATRNFNGRVRSIGPFPKSPEKCAGEPEQRVSVVDSNKPHGQAEKNTGESSTSENLVPLANRALFSGKHTQEPPFIFTNQKPFGHPAKNSNSAVIAAICWLCLAILLAFGLLAQAAIPAH